mmetsp:Transcript_5382/g.7796  ORF Transcript_5382/g.7796 Transcript_5382/m.7796 type:complete len:83 (-) Transcript_5382:556-804(-)
MSRHPIEVRLVSLRLLLFGACTLCSIHFLYKSRVIFLEEGMGICPKVSVKSKAPSIYLADKTGKFAVVEVDRNDLLDESIFV